MKKIVVNDTNVFIDLFNVGLLEELFALPWEVHTTDLVMLELQREEQKEIVARYQSEGRLHIPVFEPEEMIVMAEMKIRAGVSITDCSVWYYAKVNNYILLTGDGKLRKSSLLDGVEVHGIIYVFDELVESGILQKTTAAERLKELWKSNPRLPKEEIEKRINIWSIIEEGEEPMIQ